MAVSFQIYAIVGDDDAFGAEPEPLFEARFAGEEDSSSRAEDTMPRDAPVGAQSPHHLTGGAGMSGGFGNIAVSSDLTFRNAADGGQNVVEHACGHESIVS
jgi:hypothetical protein